MNVDIRNHFKLHDPIMLALLENMQDIKLRVSDDPFCDLLESIVSQQLSIKASDTIWNRLKDLLPDRLVTPGAILALPVEVSRTAGLSGSKASYIRNVADAFMNGLVTPKEFSIMTDEDVITQLVKIKGVGRWTAEMFLIFSLGREDVFSYGDLGLRNAVNRIYAKGKKSLSETAIIKIAKHWSPYRSYASRALWKSIDMKPISV